MSLPTASRAAAFARWGARGLMALWATAWICFSLLSGTLEAVNSGQMMMLIMHLLTGAVFLIIWLVSWRRELVGAVLLLLLIAAFLIQEGGLPAGWDLLIAKYILTALIAVLLLMSWWLHRERHPAAPLTA